MDASETNPRQHVVVFGHSASHLYEVDPTDLSVTEIAPFTWPDADDQMTDIAIDASGRMVGVSFDAVYEIDPDTGACALLATLEGDRRFVALSFVPVDPAVPDGPEKLVASSGGFQVDEGELVEIAPDTGVVTSIGPFGSGLRTSGDIVSVRGLGTFVTVRGESHDRLARLDVVTGRAELVGTTEGFDKIFGLGFWGDRLYGFTSEQGLILIDPLTGKATREPAGDGVKWWGAGVTTSAPVIL